MNLKKLILGFIVLIVCFGCGKKKSEPDMPLASVVEVENKDPYSMATTMTDKRTGLTYVQVLVPADSDQYETGRRVAEWYKHYRKKGLKNFEIHAYGDSRLMPYYLGTHGIMIIRDGKNIESHFSQAKKPISEEHLLIYLEYINLCSSLLASDKNLDVEDIIPDVNTMIKRKYDLTKNELQAIFDEIQEYSTINEY